MMGVIRAIIAVFYSAFWCGFAVVYLMIFPKKKDYVLLNVGKKWWSTYMLKWIVGSKIVVSIPEETREFFEQGKGAVLMGNHSSYLDITAAFVATPAPIVFLAKDAIRKVPLLGGANARVGTVFVKRGDKKSAFESITALVKTVSEGRCVLVFPEGTRSWDGEIKEFKKGGFHLATQANVPIIPMRIEGANKVLPRGKFFFKNRHTFKVSFGKPIIGDNVDELRDLTRDVVIKLGS